MDEVVELKTCSIFIDKNELCVIAVKPNLSAIITEENAQEICELVSEICNQKRTPILFDMSKFEGQIAPGAREIFRNNEKFAKIKCNTVVVVNSLPNRLLINFYITFNKPETPLKVMSNVDEGVKWLLKNKEVISNN